MKKLFHSLLALQIVQVANAQYNASRKASNQIKTIDGIVEGTTEKSGVRSFKGIFLLLRPPVGDLRWKEPQPVKSGRVYERQTGLVLIEYKFI